jgi:hypothetical protein
MDVSDQLHAPPAFPLGRDPGIHWIGGGMGPRVSLNTVKERNLLLLPEIKPRPFGKIALQEMNIANNEL